MMSKQRFAVWCLGIAFIVALPGIVEAKSFCVNARSAILLDMSSERVLFEQNADTRIPPASVTKILTLYLVFDAIREGHIHLTDGVQISARAASLTGSRMHVKAGQTVPLEELIKGMAVVSGNDACVAVAEYMSGSPEEFVRKMNRKARELGMENTHFVNPNGLPADGQFTTARDIAKLSIAYLHRFPDSLNIHSMQSYTFNKITHRNANRLLGKCPGVDGIKTGFVCAAGYNISATARRGNVRLLAVVLGAPSAGVRAAEAAKLLERGFQSVAPGAPEIQVVQQTRTMDDTDAVSASGTGERAVRSKIIKNIKVVTVADKGKSPKPRKNLKPAKNVKMTRQAKAIKARETTKVTKASKAQQKATIKLAQASKKNEPVKHAAAVKSSAGAKSCKAPSKAETAKQAKAKKAPEVKQAAVKSSKASQKSGGSKSASVAQTNGKPAGTDKQKLSTAPSKKTGTSKKSHQHSNDSKAKKG